MATNTGTTSIYLKLDNTDDIKMIKDTLVTLVGVVKELSTEVKGIDTKMDRKFEHLHKTIKQMPGYVDLTEVDVD